MQPQMNVSYENLKAAIVLLLVLVAGVERAVELARPLWKRIVNVNLQNLAKMGAAILVGTGLAALMRWNVIAVMGIQGDPLWADYFLAGFLASFGASVWHPILELLKKIKEPGEQPKVVS